VEEAMNKFIRLVVSGLTLCGALAVVPGIAEAREVGRSAPAHVERGPARGYHGGGREGVGPRGRELRGERREAGWGYRHPVLAHERICREGREHGDGAWRLRAMGCFVR
jgi:hypothetical protein